MFARKAYSTKILITLRLFWHIYDENLSKITLLLYSESLPTRNFLMTHLLMSLWKSELWIVN